MKNSEKNLKKIAYVLNLNKKTSLSILQHLLIKNGYISLTNLDTHVKIKTDLKGNYISSILQFNKCLSIENSKDESIDINEFPTPFEIKDKMSLPTNLLSKSLKHMVNYVATDHSRGILRNINFIPNYAAWATDGHRACIDQSILSPVVLSIKPEVILILDTLLSSGEQVENVYACNHSGENNQEFKIMHEYIQVHTTNCIITSKMEAGNLIPDVKKIVPTIDQKECVIPEDMIKLFKATIDKLIPYANDKTVLLRISGNTCCVKRTNKNSAFKITLPFQVIDPDKLPAIGINGNYFSEILSMINSGVVMKYNTAISAIYFKCENQPDFLLMPLRILEDDLGDCKELPLPIVKGKGKGTTKKRNSTSTLYLLANYYLNAITNGMKKKKSILLS